MQAGCLMLGKKTLESLPYLAVCVQLNSLIANTEELARHCFCLQARFLKNFQTRPLDLGDKPSLVLHLYQMYVFVKG